MKKRLGSILLVLALMLSLMPAAFAADGDVITGTFTYNPSLGGFGLDYQTHSFEYSDSYFTTTGYEYNKGLAAASIDFAMASFGLNSTGDDYDYSDNYANQIDYLNKCGFTDYMANDLFTQKPTANSFACGIAQKQITDNGGTYTLLAVGCRGGGYGAEWGGNVQIGASGDHEGFAIARDIVLQHIKDYIAEKNVTGRIKIWVAGYSRGAAAANLVGGALDQDLDLGSNVSLSRHDIYCYPIEAPKGTVDENCRAPVYGNIHNVVNPADVVPVVAMEEWGFDRYGVDHQTPSADKDADYLVKEAAMSAVLATYTGTGPALTDVFTMYNVSAGSLVPVKKVYQAEFYKMLTQALTTDLATSRQDYVDNLQDDMLELMAFFFDASDAESDAFSDLLKQKISDNAGELATSLISMDLDSTKQLALQIFKEAAVESGRSDYNEEELSAMFDRMLPRLKNFAKKNPIVTATLLGNILFILDGHFNELNASWIKSLPEEYMTAQQPYVYSGAFSDVSAEDWYAPYVDYAYYGKLMVGDAGQFEPNSSVTRGMFVQTLYALEGRPAVSGGNPFTDSTGWYGDAITWAYQNGVTGGVSATSFAPNQEITREEMAVMLRAYQAKSGEPASADGAISKFSDASSVSDWAVEGVNWAVANGVMAGSDDNMLHPQDTCTRAETATMIRGFCEQ